MCCFLFLQMDRRKNSLRPLKVTNKVEGKKSTPKKTPEAVLEGLDTPPSTPGCSKVGKDIFGKTTKEPWPTTPISPVSPGLMFDDGEDFLKEAESLINENMVLGIQNPSAFQEDDNNVDEVVIEEASSSKIGNWMCGIPLTPTSPKSTDHGSDDNVTAADTTVSPVNLVTIRTKAARKAIPGEEETSTPKKLFLSSNNQFEQEKTERASAFQPEEVQGRPLDLTQPADRQNIIERQAKPKFAAMLHSVPGAPLSSPHETIEEPADSPLAKEAKTADSSPANQAEPLNLKFVVPIPKTQRFNVRWVSQILPLDELYNVIKCHGPQGHVRDPYFPTRWIPYESPYWDHERNLLGPDSTLRKHQGYSVHDGVNISVFKYNDGEIRACRMYQNVTIKKRKDKWVEAKWVNVIHRDLPHRISRRSVMPTEMIPFNSPYFAEKAQDLYFPVSGHSWVCRKGMDGVQVNFRLGERGRSLFIYRNGVVIQAYPYPKI